MLTAAFLKSVWTTVVAVGEGMWFHSNDVRGINDWEKVFVPFDGWAWPWRHETYKEVTRVLARCECGNIFWNENNGVFYVFNNVLSKRGGVAIFTRSNVCCFWGGFLTAGKTLRSFIFLFFAWGVGSSCVVVASGSRGVWAGKVPVTDSDSMRRPSLHRTISVTRLVVLCSLPLVSKMASGTWRSGLRQVPNMCTSVTSPLWRRGPFWRQSRGAWTTLLLFSVVASDLCEL